jgi:hypothetical protein
MCLRSISNNGRTLAVRTLTHLGALPIITFERDEQLEVTGHG